jgi:hypothetical protein
MYVCMYVRTVDVYIGNEHDMFTWILDQIPRRQQEYSFRFIPYSSSFPSHTPCHHLSPPHSLKLVSPLLLNPSSLPSRSLSSLLISRPTDTPYTPSLPSPSPSRPSPCSPYLFPSLSSFSSPLPSSSLPFHFSLYLISRTTWYLSFFILNHSFPFISFPQFFLNILQSNTPVQPHRLGTV